MKHPMIFPLHCDSIRFNLFLITFLFSSFFALAKSSSQFGIRAGTGTSFYDSRNATVTQKVNLNAGFSHEWKSGKFWGLESGLMYKIRRTQNHNMIPDYYSGHIDELVKVEYNYCGSFISLQTAPTLFLNNWSLGVGPIFDFFIADKREISGLPPVIVGETIGTIFQIPPPYKNTMVFSLNLNLSYSFEMFNQDLMAVGSVSRTMTDHYHYKKDPSYQIDQPRYIDVFVNLVYFF